MAKRSRVYDYDLIVIGSGAAGGVAAHAAAGLKKKVAVVEADTIGGECPNYGCIPTKALLSAAKNYRIVKNSQEFGIRTSGVSFNHKKVRAWKDLAVKRTGVRSGDKAFAAQGIAVIKGRAHFINKRTISINKQRYSARHFLIATGTHNYVPVIKGLREAGYMTNRQAINLDTIPKSLFIIGGGAIGVEFAYMFSSFDTKVAIAEFSPQLLPREDKEVGEFTATMLKRDGIQAMIRTQVVAVEQKGGKKIVHFKSGHRSGSMRVDEILLAAGRRPNVDIGLENAGVKYSERGIATNDMMRTSASHIYAAGDVTGPYAFTHTAVYQSHVAIHNMFKPRKVVAKYHAIPRVVYTEPEMAAVGMTEAHLKHQKIKYRTNTVPIDIIARSNTDNSMAGFVKVIASRAGVILGAVVVAPHAGEIIHELALAVNLGLTVDDVASTVHAFPTWSQAVQVACAGMA